MDCRNIRRLIDEADKADSISLEAARHIDGCAQCGNFADERLRLRRLLASSARVTAPANFDMVLRARLAQRRSPNWLGWFNPALSLRLAAGVAMVAIAVFSVQLYRMNSNKQVIETAVNQATSTDIATVSNGASNQSKSAEIDTTPASDNRPAPVKSIVRKSTASTRVAQERRDIEQIQAAAVLLMRDHAVDRQFTISAISLGAQPIMSFDGNNQTARVVRTSF